MTIQDNLIEANSELKSALIEFFANNADIPSADISLCSDRFYIKMELCEDDNPRWDTECNIEAGYWSRPLKEIVCDDNGNEFIQMDLVVKANYPAHGSVDIEVALKRANFISKCCIAAQQIKDKLSNKIVYSLVRTSEQKKNLEDIKNTDIVRKAVVCNVKGMKIDQVKKFVDGDFSDKLVPGSYRFHIDNIKKDRLYTAEVDANKVITVKRIS